MFPCLGAVFGMDFGMASENKTKFSPKDGTTVAGSSSGSTSNSKVNTGVRNALISENSNLSPLLLSQTDYGECHIWVLGGLLKLSLMCES